MKIIIAGGRDFDDIQRLDVVMYHWDETDPCLEIVCGMAKGADALGYSWAVCNNVSLACFYADWDTHGKAAGPIRNEQMADYADVLVAFWDGKSRGTKNMIDQALKKGLETHVYFY